MREGEHVHDAEKWLLTRRERDNPATGLDRGDMAWSRGNLVRPLIDGVEYFHRLREVLAGLGPGDEIYFAAWTGTPDETFGASGTSIAGMFARALLAGVRVHGLFWCPYLDVRKDFVPENRDFAALLRSLGASAVLDQRVRAAGSHHQKFLVVRRPGRPQDDVAFVGGIDPCPSRYDDQDHDGDPQVQQSIARVYGERPAWHDVHLEVRGPAVAEVEHGFRERWNDSASLRRIPFRLPRRGRTASSTAELPAQQPAPPRCGSHSVQLLRTYPNKMPSYPFAPRGERSVAHGYLKALRKARHFIYVEDQFLWSPMVAEAFAAALRREPRLRLIAVLASRPDKEGKVQVAASDVARGKAVDLLRAAGGDRVDLYELEHPAGVPIYVHSKVCVVDDVWATVGSANLNRRSWTYDSELNAAVVSEPGHSFVADLRRRLWLEHLGRDDDGTDLADPGQGIETLRYCAADLERWHDEGRRGVRPQGRLRRHTRPETSALTRAWGSPVGRAIIDPDGRPAAR